MEEQLDEEEELDKRDRENQPKTKKKDSSRKIRKVTLILLAFLLVFGAFIYWFMGPGNHEGEVQIPGTEASYIGQYYANVVPVFENQGFLNVEAKPVKRFATAKDGSEGMVESVSVGGRHDYETEEWVPADTKVVIRYYTRSEHSLDQAAGVIGQKIEETTGITDADQAIKDGVDKAEDLAEDVLNSEEFKDFAEEYLEKEVSFDGTVERIDAAGNGTYNVFLSKGKIRLGSIFVIKNVTLGQMGANSVEALIEKPVHVTGKVTGFDTDTGKVVLQLISVTAR